MTTLTPLAQGDVQSDLPLLTRLLPGLVSAIALLPATLALQFHRDFGLLAPLLLVQGLLLALGAASLAREAHGRLSVWESRIAPAAAREHVRAQLLRDLGTMVAIGLAGPLVCAGVKAVVAGQPQPVLGALALLAASVCAGLSVSLGWHGRLPRLLLAPVLLLPVVLMQPAAIGAVSGGDAGTALPIVACAGLLVGWLLSRRSLVACARPLPRLQPMGWWRWCMSRVWRTVPQGAKGRELPYLLLFCLPQFQSHAQRAAWLAWGQVYSHPYAAPGYGLWLAVLGAFFGGALIAPPLQWRHRLAPCGLTALRWARRLVLGSMLFHAAWFSLGLGFAALSQPLPASAWAGGLGDVLLVSSFAAWERGRRNASWRSQWPLAALGLGAAAAIAAANGLGLAPQRGGLWLAIEAALTVAFTRAAIAAWARRDLNALA